MLQPAPGGDYTAADRAEEAALCAIDFHAGSWALCPKTFSTSPGTLVYELSGGPYEGRAAEFEAEECDPRHVRGDPVSYKMTMNAPGTSATFAPASWLYYHFSRYFGTAVHVPPSVYRSMDRQSHFERVVRPGLAASARDGVAEMNRIGWRILADGAKDPASYRPSAELYTRQGGIYGTLLRQQGRRYGAEINGTRESGWGSGQNRDFQQTAPYLALREDAPLAEAIEHGIRTAARDPVLRKAMGGAPGPVQMTYWMEELTEIALLDYIFSQQDRIGNIDYVDYWYWVEDGRVSRIPVAGRTPPGRIAGFSPVKIRRTHLNDNDAGGRIPYANFAKKTGMLEKIRHLSPRTYTRLIHLADDFEERGELYAWLRATFGLSERQIDQVVSNTVMAAGILRDSCVHGRLRFDLDPEAMLVRGETDDIPVACHDN